MHRYTIDPSGFWRLYHPIPVQEGWQMLGTIRRASDRSMGALGRSPDGLYVQINGDDVRMEPCDLNAAPAGGADLNRRRLRNIAIGAISAESPPELDGLRSADL